METAPQIEISAHVIKEHLIKYSFSLQPYRKHYLSFWQLSDDSKYFGYLCPLCLINGFWIDMKEVLYGAGGPFSLDHYPPESVGGWEKIVVCKKCNSKAGSEYDAALPKKLSALSFNAKIQGSTLPAKSAISTIKGNYSSKVSIRADGEFEVSFKPNPKAHAPLLDDWLEASTTDLNWTVDVTIPIPDETLVARAMLKAAYLYCFAGWGYEFSYSYTGSLLRQVIFGEGSYPLNVPAVWLGESAGEGMSMPIGLCKFSTDRLHCFAVCMPVKDITTKFSDLACILIPGPDEENWNEVMNTFPLLTAQSSLTLSVAHITEHLITDGTISGYTESWQALNNN